MKYPDITTRQVEAVWRKLGGSVGVQQFLHGEGIATQTPLHWTVGESSGPASVSTIANGITGEGWMKRFRESGILLTRETKNLIASPQFSITRNGTLLRIIIIRAEAMRSLTKEYTSRGFFAFGEKARFRTACPDVACILRYILTTKLLGKMGLDRVLVMHTPIGPDQNLLVMNQKHGRRRIDTCSCTDIPPDISGFAFVGDQI